MLRLRGVTALTWVGDITSYIYEVVIVNTDSNVWDVTCNLMMSQFISEYSSKQKIVFIRIVLDSKCHFTRALKGCTLDFWIKPEIH